LPLEFAEAAAYERVESGEEVVIEDVGQQLRSGREVVARNRSRGETVLLRHSLSAREIEVLLAGGLLNYAARRPAGM
ncbi:MAG: aconitate hydratase, partial [Firmicutes bacterium]|nr:aconitate hydratase [Bacillota bacterium]